MTHGLHTRKNHTIYTLEGLCHFFLIFLVCICVCVCVHVISSIKVILKHLCCCLGEYYNCWYAGKRDNCQEYQCYFYAIE